ncbi:organic cation transporter protein [Folsomia candida]|uniref:Organic cation transporter protein n=1 Tax=Folsomia candida TaxID=158441 RepID=A0A226F537_FOLCA|nr:organic cation transporter protein [Folsomia candida]XP_035702567.1 organic cation transporter protein [Folsomia candida]OXA64925.1 Organic cation transporter protein [Folsomia candida]
MNELLNTEAEELGLRQSQRHVRKQSGGDLSSTSEDETETISVHIQCKIENSDDLLRLCGDSGVWQVLIFILGSFCGLNCSIQNFLYIFISDTTDYWCTFPEVDKDRYTDKELKTMLLPRDSGANFEKCSRYSSDVSNGTIVSIHRTIIEKCNTETIPVQYEGGEFVETIGSEWSLVCEEAYWLPAVEATYMVGVLVGSIVFGMLSDKLGRRFTIWISTFMFVFFSPLVALSTNFVSLLIFRFCLGIASPGVYSTSYVLVVESIGSHRRGLAGSLYSIPYSAGYMILPIIAYFVREWRNLQLTCAALSPLMILTWWYLEESPRWLLLKGKVAESETLFREIARVNGKELPKDFHALVKKVAYAERESKYEITCDQRCRNCTTAVCKLIHTPVLRFRVFCMSIAFLAISLVYYGIAIDPTNLGFDRYLFAFLCGLFEIPAEIIVASLIDRSGRKPVFAGFFVTCGSMIFLSFALPRGSIGDVVLFVAAQLFISGNSTLIYLYSAELFPTEIRGYCLGISSMVGRTGSIAVPYIVELVGEKHHTYPTIIFGSAALIAGALALCLPETRNKKLPDTVVEVESCRR